MDIRVRTFGSGCHTLALKACTCYRKRQIEASESDFSCTATACTGLESVPVDGVTSWITITVGLISEPLSSTSTQLKSYVYPVFERVSFALNTKVTWRASRFSAWFDRKKAILWFSSRLGSFSTWTRSNNILRSSCSLKVGKTGGVGRWFNG